MSSFVLKSSRFFAIASLAAFALASCGAPSTAQTQSSVSTVNPPQTNAKWQSIGNCWIYSFASWVESKVLATTDGAESLNLSESYVTYLHYRTQLSNRFFSGKEIQTGGWFETAASLTLANGYMLEGDFAPEESDKTFSKRQSKATDYINASLKNGILKTDRTPETIKAELNAAFGIDIDALAPLVKPARSLSLRNPTDGTTVTFAGLCLEAARLPVTQLGVSAVVA
jgi:hypothetical protein